MESIVIDGKKYVRVDERILELHRRKLRFSLYTDHEFIPTLNLFVAEAHLVIHQKEGDLTFVGTASRRFAAGTYNTAAVSWAETIARGRAIGIYLAPALKEIGAEIISEEEIQKEEPPEAAPTLTSEALKALKTKRK